MNCESSLSPQPETRTERIPLLRKLGEPVLEVNNDHFPTAIFQRRIVEVLDPSGQRCLALEDDMSLLRLEPVGTERKATVASIRDADKFAALNRVLGETGFDAILEAKRKDSEGSGGLLHRHQAELHVRL